MTLKMRLNHPNHAAVLDTLLDFLIADYLHHVSCRILPIFLTSDKSMCISFWNIFFFMEFTKMNILSVQINWERILIMHFVTDTKNFL